MSGTPDFYLKPANASNFGEQNGAARYNSLPVIATVGGHDILITIAQVQGLCQLEVGYGLFIGGNKARIARPVGPNAGYWQSWVDTVDLIRADSENYCKVDGVITFD